MTNPEINENGTKHWFNSEGKYHRENGPAIERADGTKSWYLNGEEVRKQDVIKLPPIPVEMSPTSGILKMIVGRTRCT